jgi:histidine ammonia-lyase
LETGTLAKKAYDGVRALSPRVTADRPLAPDINAVHDLIATGVISKVLH